MKTNNFTDTHFLVRFSNSLTEPCQSSIDGLVWSEPMRWTNIPTSVC